MYVVAHSPRLHCHTKSATPVLTQDAFRALARDGSSTTAVTTAIITVARSAQPYGGTPHIPWRVLRCDVPAASSKAAIEEGLVLFLGGVGGGGGGSKMRQVTLARHSHTHRGGRSRRERGCSQERSPQRPFRCTCVNSRWEKAGGRGGGGERCDESRFEQLRRCFPTPHLSRGQHGTGKYRRLLFHDTFAHYYNLAHNGERLFAGRNCGGEGE